MMPPQAPMMMGWCNGMSARVSLPSMGLIGCCVRRRRGRREGHGVWRRVGGAFGEGVLEEARPDLAEIEGLGGGMLGRQTVIGVAVEPPAGSLHLCDPLREPGLVARG